MQGESLEKMSVGIWKDLLIAYEKDVSSHTVPSSCGMAEKLRWAMPSIAGSGLQACKYMAAVPAVPPRLASMEVRLSNLRVDVINQGYVK